MSSVRFSLYPLREDFVPLILDAIDGLARFDIGVETDDLSTYLAGDESTLFEAVRASFGRVARSGAPLVLRATFSTEMPVEPTRDAYASHAGDEPGGGMESWLPERVNAQFALYPLGADIDRDTARTVIERAREAHVRVVERPLCTHLYGRGDDVFDILRSAFTTARAGAMRTVMTITVAANGPSSTATKGIQ
jgi:uncharacterized protein YqgV (UPF0045/DUF77 family)